MKLVLFLGFAKYHKFNHWSGIQLSNECVICVKFQLLKHKLRWNLKELSESKYLYALLPVLSHEVAFYSR